MAENKSVSLELSSSDFQIPPDLWDRIVNLTGVEFVPGMQVSNLEATFPMTLPRIIMEVEMTLL